MQKLTKENIQFIENYLENSDIFYADIRMEMTDHVASAIEDKMNQGDSRDFYYIFKDYMVENKARLLNDNRKFLKSADKKVTRLLLKNTFTIQAFIVFMAIIFIFVLVFNWLGIEMFSNKVLYIPILSIVPFGIIYSIAIYAYKLNRFSVIERLFFPYIVLMQLLNLSRIILDKFITETNSAFIFIAIMSILLTLFYVLIKVSFNIAISYKKQFKNIN